jgi:hypothetical protein
MDLAWALGIRDNFGRGSKVGFAAGKRHSPFGCLHGKLVNQQASVATMLNQVNRWGKFLTTTVLVYGVALVAGLMYMG